VVKQHTFPLTYLPLRAGAISQQENALEHEQDVEYHTTRHGMHCNIMGVCVEGPQSQGEDSRCEGRNDRLMAPTLIPTHIIQERIGNGLKRVGASNHASLRMQV
jgi:hypothetical protein